jgi:replicative DNA helicase
MRGTFDAVHHAGLDLGDRAWRWSEPGGIDVRTPHGFRELHRVLDRSRPDLVCIGPVYKMSTSHGDKYEVEAAEVQQAVDRLRREFGCAFFLEHHTGKGEGGKDRSGDPFGSSYWMRWPEFGLAMKEAKNAEESGVYELGRFRGDRDVRQWPSTLIRSDSLANAAFPWLVDWDSDRDTWHTLLRICEESLR